MNEKELDKLLQTAVGKFGAMTILKKVLDCCGMFGTKTVGPKEACRILEQGSEWLRRNDSWIPHTGTGKCKRYDRETLIAIVDNGYCLPAKLN